MLHFAKIEEKGKQHLHIRRRDASPGEFANDADGQYNKAQNEKLYTQLFGDALQAAGMPNHAIVDTGR